MFKNKEDALAYKRRWYHENRDRMLAYHRQWSMDHPGVIEASRDAFELRNKDRRIAERHQRYEAKKPKWAKQNYERQQGYKRTVLNALGGHCFCCGETEFAFLTLEHLHNDGNIHRASGKHIYLDVIKQGMPKDRYGVLCMNCNFARRFGKKCPHQRVLLEIAA